MILLNSQPEKNSQYEPSPPHRSIELRNKCEHLPAYFSVKKSVFSPPFPCSCKHLPVSTEVLAGSKKFPTPPTAKISLLLTDPPSHRQNISMNHNKTVYYSTLFT